MSLPPRITRIDNTVVADTAASVQFTVLSIPGGRSLTVFSSDTEGDPITLESWMVWDAPTHTLTFVAPPASANGKAFYVNVWVTTPSGGTDSFIALVKVVTRPLFCKPAPTPVRPTSWGCLKTIYR